jgi:EAL domain-containing protein (putative c-di-GMP-specific phosphodiesterase class I)
MDAVLHRPFTLAALAKILAAFIEPAAVRAPALQVEAAPAQPLAPGPVAIDPRLIDPQVAAALAGMAAAGKGDFVEKVRGLYRDNAPAAVAELLAAAQTGEAGSAARAAQALKSMSLNIGAREVARRAAEMEEAARAGAPPQRTTVLMLEQVLKDTLAALSASAASIPAPPIPLAPMVTMSVASPPPEVRALLDDLSEAIDGGDQLSMVYQPQFDREGQLVLGVESLVRWTHPTRGVVNPADFIPVAEAWGSIRKLTDWVMNRAVLETGEIPGLQVAFNASALEFIDEGIVERIQGLLARTGFDPRRLEIEITETAILNNEEQVRDNMNALREMGLKVALDDFGAGYSSLGHLRRYPFDKLKIDREFVIDCTRDVQSATVVHAVVSIGRALGMKVVAEGVETEQQRQFLKIAGVHAMQGYLFGKPMPIAELKAMMSPEAIRARA